VATPKEAAVLFLLDNLGAKPAEDPQSIAEILAPHYPQFKLTTARMEKIQEAYEKEVARIKKMYTGYLKGRGIKA